MNTNEPVIACVCRNIYEEDYQSKEDLLKRLIEPDARCRQCLLRYGVDPYDYWKPERTI